MSTRPKPIQAKLFEPVAPSVSSTDDGVVVRELQCKTVLNHSGRTDYSFNCYTGCSHGCVYCYARFMQRFHPHEEPWGEFVDVKVNAVDVLRRQLKRLPPGTVFTCSACDGWQPSERRYELTRQCCRMLVDAGFELHVLTKSDLVLRDLEVLAAGNVSLGVTITTPDEGLAKLWEPKASTVAARLKVLRRAKQAGMATTIMFGPLLPGLSDTDAALRQLFEMAADVGVDRVWTDALNARPKVWPSVQLLVYRHWPQLLGLYRQILFDTAYREEYCVALDERIRRAAEETGVPM